MKTTTKRKTMSLVFEPIEVYGQSFEVSTGQQKLGRVSYQEKNGEIFVTHIEIEPYLTGFNIEAQILDALLTNDSVKCISVISDSSSAVAYHSDGFKYDPELTLLRKIK